MAFAPLIPGQEIKYDDVGGVMTSTALQSLCEHLIRYSFAHSLYIGVLYACKCGGNPGASERYPSGISLQNARATYNIIYTARPAYCGPTPNARIKVICLRMLVIRKQHYKQHTYKIDLNCAT